ncbi:MAG: hypothetical protein EXS16_00695 [Gemmataceae bacterium]|nr:hypothetical protein [Gemmataceae bacterium]
MVVRNPIDEITEALHSLPKDKLPAVKDFVDFLNARANPLATVDVSDEWTEEDLRDFKLHCQKKLHDRAPWDEPATTAANGTVTTPEK